MTTKPKTIGASMRQLRRQRASSDASSAIPQAMVESIRQSMRIEGYDLSAEEVREAAERSLKKAA